MAHEFPREEALRVRIHPLNSCGPVQIALERGDQCRMCGVAAGSEPTPEELEAVRKVWPHYPNGFWA